MAPSSFCFDETELEVGRNKRAFSRLRWKISRRVFRGGGFLEGERKREREKKQLSLCHGWLTKTNVRRSYQVKSGIPLLRERKTGPER